MKLLSACVSIVSLTIFAGCTEQPLTDEEADEVAGVDQNSGSHSKQGSNAVDRNGLDWNGLDWNGLDWNGLDWNGLDWNGLDWNGLDWNNLDPDSTNGVIYASLQDTGSSGNVARAVVRHLVRCAFKSSQAFTFKWVDGSGTTHAESYSGHLGLAPYWESHSLGLNGQRLVSACMAAHVNYFGAPVMISLRSGEKPIRLRPNDPELSQFPKVEGAFWGNLWADPPYMHACYNQANKANSNEHLRDCATGHKMPDGTVQECGIIDVVGPCDQACRVYNPVSKYYDKCSSQPGHHGWNNRIITTALPD